MTVDAPGERQAPPDLGPITDELRPAPSGLGQRTLSDVARGLRSYRPVLFVVLGVLVLAALLPGPRRVVLDGFSSAAVDTSPASRLDAAAGDVAGTDGATTAAAPVVGGALQPSPGTFELGYPWATVGSVPMFGGSTPPSSYSPDPSGATSGATGTSSSATPVPLRLTEAAWATRSAGTPLATLDVPEGSLPVGTRVGQDDKQSFVRLSGTAPRLTLRPVGPEGQRSAETAVIQACPITESGWTAGEAMAWDARPAYATEGCVAGTRAADGSWTFDLSGSPDRGGMRGFALVPGPDAPLDFQVAFARD